LVKLPIYTVDDLFSVLQIIDLDLQLTLTLTSLNIISKHLSYKHSKLLLLGICLLFY